MFEQHGDVGEKGQLSSGADRSDLSLLPNTVSLLKKGLNTQGWSVILALTSSLLSLKDFALENRPVLFFS